MCDIRTWVHIYTVSQKKLPMRLNSLTLVRETLAQEINTDDAWGASPKPTHWHNQFAEKETNVGPFLSMSKRWNAFSFSGLYPRPLTKSSAPIPCRDIYPVAFGGVKGNHNLSNEQIHFSHVCWAVRRQKSVVKNGSWPGPLAGGGFHGTTGTMVNPTLTTCSRSAKLVTRINEQRSRNYF